MWFNGQKEMVTKPSDDEQKTNAPDRLIENIAEASKNARKIYFLYIGFLAYCALTVVSTSDRQIILNEKARLPFLNLDIPLNWFFILAPIIAIFVFLYFQLYLDIRKDLIDHLRTYSPAPERKRLYPWIFIAIDYPKPGFVGKVQTAVVQFSIWWSLPPILILTAFWFVKRHDPTLSYVVGSIPIVGTAVALGFWCHYEGLKITIKQMPKVFLRNMGKTTVFLLVLVFEILLLFFVIPCAMEGGKHDWLRPLICVDLSDQRLVTEPKTDYEGLFWIKLKGAHLEGANLINTVLKRADLREAKLQRAQIGSAILEGARLLLADLREANLVLADLRGADLYGADLRGAILHEANLQEADLRGAKLQIIELSPVKTLYKAILDPEIEQQIKKIYPHLLEKPKAPDSSQENEKIRQNDLPLHHPPFIQFKHI